MAAASRDSTFTRLSSNIAPFVLLSVLTSIAFNRAILARERVEQRRLHSLQLSLLRQIASEAASSSSSLRPSSSLLGTFEDQKKLARRLRTLELDPITLGFSRDVLPSLEEEGKLRNARDASTSWGSALFGSGIAAKMREAMGKASNAVREQGLGFGKARDSSVEDAADEEWLRALEESLDGSSQSRVEERGAAPTTQTQPSISLRDEDTDKRSGSSGWSLSSASIPEHTEQTIIEPNSNTDIQPERRRVYM